MQVPFLSLKDVTDLHKKEYEEAVLRVVNSGWYLLGEETDRFEKDYAKYIGTNYCISVANGLQALELMLKACMLLYNWHDGDEVIVQANTYIATILAITKNGLRPVLVEPDPLTLEVREEELKSRITNKTKGIMLVHLYGRCIYNKQIAKLCSDYGVMLFEDNAQAHGCCYAGKKTGSFGVAAAHSFYPGKNLGAFGDAGAVTTDDEKLAEMIRCLSNYGSSRKYIFDYIGDNSRLDEIQAAVLDVKLKYLDEDNKKRKEIAKYYYERISNPLISLPTRLPDESNVFHIFPVFCETRDRLAEYLAENSIGTVIHYPVPPHKQKCYSYMNDLSLPVTEHIHRTELSIPISPAMDIKQAEYVVEKLNKYNR